MYILYIHINLYILNSWREKQLVKAQIFPNSFDLAAVH